MAASKGCSPAEEDEGESETCADPSVLPVEAGGDDLRLADRPGLRADELDLVAWRSVRGRADDLDQIATADGVVRCRGARHAVVRCVDDVRVRGEVRGERLVGARRRAWQDADALIHTCLRDGSRERCDGKPEGDPLDKPIPFPIAAHLPAPFLLTSTAD